MNEETGIGFVFGLVFCGLFLIVLYSFASSKVSDVHESIKSGIIIIENELYRCEKGQQNDK